MSYGNGDEGGEDQDNNDLGDDLGDGYEGKDNVQGARDQE